MKPTVVDFPSFLLTFCQIRSHDGCRTQKPKQAKLSVATEKEPRHRGEMIEPPAGGAVVGVPVVGERHPNVDVRGKK